MCKITKIESISIGILKDVEFYEHVYEEFIINERLLC